MKRMKILNPFNAPVFYEETVSSTMDISRRLADDGCAHGTVICADYQEAGRGRIPERQWLAEKKTSLPFTILLRYAQIEDIPPAITLRTGLAVSLAVEDFILVLQNEKEKKEEKKPPVKIFIKWPNDIMIGNKKAGGILTENSGGIIHIGIGVNIAQKTFPLFLKEKAASIALSSEIEIKPDDRFILLEKILLRLYSELETDQSPLMPESKNWKQRIEQRFFKKDEQVIFKNGAAESEKEIKGTLTGISETGELLIIPEGETTPRAYITGELKY